MKRFICQAAGYSAETYDADLPGRVAENYVGDIYRYRGIVPASRVVVAVHDSETGETKTFTVKTEIKCFCTAIEDKS